MKYDLKKSDDDGFTILKSEGQYDRINNYRTGGIRFDSTKH